MRFIVPREGKMGNRSCWAFSAAVLALFLGGCSHSSSKYYEQMEMVPEAERTFSAVFDAKGFNKEQVFRGTKLWLAETFKSSKAVIDYESLEEGVVVGNGAMPYPPDGCEGMICPALAGWIVSYKVKIDIKDEKFRLTFTNLEIFMPATYGTFGTHSSTVPLVINTYMSAVKPKLLALGPALQSSLGKGATPENW